MTMEFKVLLRPALLAATSGLAGQVAIAQEPAPATPAVQPAPTAPVVNEALKYSNKWRIEVDEGANNDGVAKFRLTPKGEASIDVQVSIPKGRSENHAAQDVRDAFKAALDPKRFHVETDDGEDVLVKRTNGPDFAIELVESTLKGTHFDLERE
jgi:hypothetical protein